MKIPICSYWEWPLCLPSQCRWPLLVGDLGEGKLAVDFSFINIVNVISQELFGGNTTVGGLVIMLAVAFLMMAVLANIKAPVQYSLVPVIILAIVFAALNIMDMTVSFVIIIISAVIVATGVRNMIS